MNRKTLHYHIRWSGRAALDWECFNTYAEAAATAKQLVQPHESFRIEEYDEACLRCRKNAMNLKSEHGTSKGASA